MKEPQHATDKQCQQCRQKAAYVCTLPKCGTKICSSYMLERENCPGCKKTLTVRVL